MSVIKVDENGIVKEHINRDTRIRVNVCMSVCVTARNWANDAGILLGTWHSILTQVAKVAGDCKNSCMC